jgi:hypothetical protein
MAITKMVFARARYPATQRTASSQAHEQEEQTPERLGAAFDSSSREGSALASYYEKPFRTCINLEQADKHQNHIEGVIARV